LLRRRRNEEYGGYVLGPQEEDRLGWEVRSFVYAHLVEHGLPSTAEQTATGLGIEPEQTRAAYERLHARHILFLDPETREVRMAFPFSGVPTPFRVRSNGRSYWANCAWDMLGIPAALHSDAEVETEYAEHDSPARLSVEGGELQGDAGLVHFPLPLRRWYEDLARIIHERSGELRFARPRTDEMPLKSR
jgi:hypothetical protein